MKQSLRINEIKPKVSKNGKAYLQVNGKHSVFEKDIIRTFEDNVGKTFDVEIVENNGFSNIREIYSEGTETITQPQENQNNQERSIEVKQIVKSEIQNDEIILKKEKPNSRTIGKGDNQIKLYFDTPEDLANQIKSLEELGLMPIPTEKF